MEAKAPPQAIESLTTPKQGGWKTIPFLAGSMLGLSVAISGAMGNMIVYLIQEFNVKSIDAAQINNIINGCISLAPVAGAIISDAFFGCFPVVAFSTFISFLSLIVFTLTATIRSLRQLAVLYLAVALLSVGAGGTRFNTGTMGADQFDRARDQDAFFNWYFVIMYVSSIIGGTVVVYVQDNVSWGLGFGLCSAANAVSVAVLMMGRKYYRRPAAQGSPFAGLARVVVAAVRKRKMECCQVERLVSYYHGIGEEVKLSCTRAPTQRFRFLNCAALIAQGDTNADGSVAKPWSLCTVEQVEDLKTLLLICPLWSCSIFLAMSIGIQVSLTVLQALTMDRSLGPHFSIPAGSIVVSMLASVALFIPLFDHLLIPLCHRITHRTPTPLQRIGLGHLLNTAAMAVAALVERRRAGIVRAHNAAAQPNWIVNMSVLWLVLPLAVLGLGEALHFPGQVSLYYQEFPKKLRSTASGMVALLIAIGFYTSTAVIDLIRRATTWLPDNINQSRLENVYWMLAVLGVINFGYYVLCARMYKYRSSSTETITAAVTRA